MSIFFYKRSLGLCFNVAELKHIYMIHQHIIYVYNIFMEYIFCKKDINITIPKHQVEQQQQQFFVGQD